MSLPTRLVERIEAALLDAFPEDDALDRLIRRLEMQALVPARAALVTRVSKLVEIADAQGRALDLFDAALELARGNVLVAQARPAIFAEMADPQSAIRTRMLGTVEATRDPTVVGTAPTAAKISQTRAAARPLTTPTPAYASAEVEALSKGLEDARARKRNLRDAGIATDEVDREILELRRKLRDGGQLRAGDTLSDGRYLLVKQVGRGGFAVVWEAYDRQELSRVAVKVLHMHLAGDPQRRERFFRGARVMMDLQHPAVVRVYNPRGEDDAFCYFVMEFVPGGNLRDVVLGNGVDAGRRLPLILQVGEALAEAHKKGLVHRDVKPANILLDEGGNAKLTDFDLVGANDTTGGTRSGALGTVVYAAPECLDKPQEATARADVFGLGMTAIFCMTGRDLSMATFRNPAAAVAQLCCPVAVRNVLERAVGWEPEDRFADAGALVAALQFPGHGTIAKLATRTKPATPTSIQRALDAVAAWPAEANGTVDDVERPNWAVASGKDAYGPWAVFEVNGVQQRMRWIPPGTFIMGSPETEPGRSYREGPQHEVTLTRGCWLGETPVTQALWVAVMSDNPSRFCGERSDEMGRPVEQVSWDDCQAFCEHLNAQVDGLAARLPTEAEWEHACRAGTRGATWAGEPSGEEKATELDAIAWYVANSGGTTHPVACKAANPYGLQDMLGNVYEWCADNRRLYTATPVTDPVGASQTPSRVFRGGSWFSSARYVRGASRLAYDRDYRHDYLGFRLARG